MESLLGYKDWSNFQAVIGTDLVSWPMLWLRSLVEIETDNHHS